MVRRRSRVRFPFGAQVAVSTAAAAAGGVSWSERTTHNREVAGSSPAPATRPTESHADISNSKRGITVASKSQDVRPKITLACSECKERNYITKKNRRNTPDRLELQKYCPRCRKSTLHRETR